MLPMTQFGLFGVGLALPEGGIGELFPPNESELAAASLMLQNETLMSGETTNSVHCSTCKVV